MKKYGFIAANIVLVLSTIAAVASAVAVTTFRIGLTPVLSNSMSPTFSAGEVVLTRPEQKSRLEIGDVVILPLPDGSGERYLHRIIELQENKGEIHVRTQGDSNASPDPWVLQIDSEKVPVAIAALPKIALVSSYVQTPSLRLAIGTAVFVLALVGIIRAVRDLRHQSLIRRVPQQSFPYDYSE